MTNLRKKVLLGNDPWSQQFIKLIKSLPHYRTLIQLQNNPAMPMEHTDYYKWLSDELTKNGTVWDGILNNKEDIIKQYKNFINMYEMAPNWKTLKDDNGEKILYQKIKNHYHYYGHYPVRINDKGYFSLYDGHHRIAILLFMKKPVELTICERSPNWEKLINELKNMYKGKNLYQPIPHPDFNNWNSSRDNKKENILKTVSMKYNLHSMIDLGICHGYTLYELKDVVKKGIGVESNPIRYKIANMLLSNIGFSCFNEDIFSFIKHNNDEVDCILALAVFHHFFSNHSLNEFKEFLKLISQKTKYLIYELPHSKEEQYKWIPSDININLIIEKITKFDKIEEHLMSNNRKLIILKK